MNNNKLVFSHRGLHDNIIPENSMPAFEKSIELGINIELDVQLTKDNKLIVFHDSNLKRLTNVDKNIKNCTLDEINKLTLLNTNYKIPTLLEVLSLINGKVSIYIEIKSRNNTKIICQELLNLLNSYTGKVYIASFNPFDLMWFKRSAPNYERIQLSLKNFKKENYFFRYLLKNTIFNMFTKPKFVSYKYNEISEKLQKKYHKSNIGILVWTITAEEEFNKALEKYDGAIFEGFIPK